MKKPFLLSASVILLLVACNKEVPRDKAVSADNQISVLVDKSISAMDNQEVLSDDQTQTIYMVNDGIAADFLAEAACMEENGQGMSADLKFILDNSFIRCLKGLSLSDPQLKDIKQDLQSYYGCNKKALERARTIYKEFKEKYHLEYLRLWKALQNGTITREEFRNQLAKLRIAFKQELRKMHLEEKLDEALKSCLRDFLTSLNGVLTESQWLAFDECYNR